MTTGALIFAFNNEQTDYVGLARWSAKNIQRHLGIPVAIVTDDPEVASYSEFQQVIVAQPQSGGTRYFEDYDKTVTWHNAGRTSAYELTPWSQTLVLDADYVVASNMLCKVLASPSNFMCHKTAYDLSTAEYLDDLNKFGDYAMPMWWATVMMFRKSNTAQYIFDCMQMIKDNWQHYRDLYGIRKSTYRNDFALSIALGIVSGQTNTVDEIPWPLGTVTPTTGITKMSTDVVSDYYTLKYRDSLNNEKCMSFGGTDFHAMGKRDLETIVATS